MGELFISIGKFLFDELKEFKDKSFYKPVIWTIGLLACLAWMFLNPTFGSTSLKASLIYHMVDDSDDLRSIFDKLKGEEKFKLVLENGAAGAGFYTAKNRNIVDEWERESRDSKFGDQDNASADALQAARERAEALVAPFQVLGRLGYASSPGCAIDRPGYQKVYINTDHYAFRDFHEGDYVRITNTYLGGTPVIARVEVPDSKMPPNVDFYLNREQMVHMLGRTDAVVPVKILKTDKSPNQPEDDEDPDEPKVHCRKVHKA